MPIFHVTLSGYHPSVIVTNENNMQPQLICELCGLPIMDSRFAEIIELTFESMKERGDICPKGIR